MLESFPINSGWKNKVLITSSFAIKPTKGGMPAKDNKGHAKSKARIFHSRVVSQQAKFDKLAKDIDSRKEVPRWVFNKERNEKPDHIKDDVSKYTTKKVYAPLYEKKFVCIVENIPEDIASRTKPIWEFELYIKKRLNLACEIARILPHAIDAIPKNKKNSDVNGKL